MATLWHRIASLLRHQWQGSRRLPQQLRGPALGRMEARVAQGERRHSGQVRICIEAALPLAWAWRVAPARERAIAWFGKLRVWDTEHNNGVLVYLLLAERRIEIVADRALARAVAPAEWDALVARMGTRLHAGDWEGALNLAVDDVSALLERHSAGLARMANELPDAPFLAREDY